MNNSRLEPAAWSRRRVLQASAATALTAGLASLLASPAAAASEAAVFGVKLAWIPNVEYCGYYLALSEGHLQSRRHRARADGRRSELPGGAARGLWQGPGRPRGRAGERGQRHEFGLEAENRRGAVPEEPGMLGVARGCAGETPKEIEGKRLGITLAGKNTALVFMRMNDVDTSKVTLVPIQYDPAPLAAGEIDAVVGLCRPRTQPVSLGRARLSPTRHAAGRFRLQPHAERPVRERRGAPPTKRDVPRSAPSERLRRRYGRRRSASRVKPFP